MENNIEFEEMRAQIAILKEKLDKETLITDKMMREVLNTKVNSLRNKQRIEYLCGLFVICVAPYSFKYSLNVSWWFILFTDLMMLFCMSATYYMYNPVVDKNLMNGDLLEVTKKVSRFKHQMKNWLYIGFPLIGVWFSWLLTEMYMNNTDRHFVIITGIALFVGLIIGAFIGIRLLFSAINTADEIIQQIED